MTYRHLRLVLSAVACSTALSASSYATPAEDMKLVEQLGSRKVDANKLAKLLKIKLANPEPEDPNLSTVTFELGKKDGRRVDLAVVFPSKVGNDDRLAMYRMVLDSLKAVDKPLRMRLITQECAGEQICKRMCNEGGDVRCCEFACVDKTPLTVQPAND